MRHALVAANWKMNGSLAANTAFARSSTLRKTLEETLQKSSPDESPEERVQRAERAESAERLVQVAIFPPAVYLPTLVAALNDQGLDAIAVGTQDVGISASGAHTGEIAAEMVADCGGRWAIVGHSERRLDQQEKDDLVATKAAAALRGGLQPLICVGETLAERQAGQEIAVVERQLDAVLDRIECADLANAAIGYEPVWAIGTGETATPDQAQAMHSFIRAHLAKADAQAAAKIRIVYGGSVKPDNALELFSEEDIDGGLVGGASLDADSFAQIVAAADECARRKSDL